MKVTVSHPVVSEVRLSIGQVAELEADQREGIAAVVLEACGLEAPRQWMSELETPADRIVVDYVAGGRRYERSWVLQAHTTSARYYALSGDSSSSGYVTRRAA
ncbi:hypothetical protein ACFQ9V_11785 [Leifsonia sp. NPDC056665]|uniref:hypothetical protein n=1 Tax=Leifsonia sp. NPDC056665 TaxID=3345901 RepID=UPI00369EB4A7